MENGDRNRDHRRDVRNRIGVRLAVHWALFFGVALFLTATLEFLFGEPRRPSLALLSEAFQRHALLFAAILVLIPISLRDCLKFIDRTMFPEQKTQKNAASAFDRVESESPSQAEPRQTATLSV
jgi:hypothetical protein